VRNALVAWLLLCSSLFAVAPDWYSDSIGSAQTVSASTAKTLSKAIRRYVHTGTGTPTWTLPTAPTDGFNYDIRVENRGSGTVTLARDGAHQIFTSSAVNSVSIPTGVGYTVEWDGTYWMAKKYNLNETGTGSVVLNNSPQLVTPELGTPASGNLLNCSNIQIGSITGFGSGVQAFLESPSAANFASMVVGETGTGNPVLQTSPTLITPLLGTPTSGTLTNCTGYTVGNISGLGTGVATALATPSSANWAAAVTGETGAGPMVFGTGPNFSGPTTDTLVASGDVSAASFTNTTNAATSNRELHLKLDGNANDSSGNGRNGTFTGTPAYSSNAIYTQGSIFDGSQKITVTGLLGSPSNVSICAWIRPDNLDSSASDVINIGSALTIRLTDANTVAFVVETTTASNWQTLSVTRTPTVNGGWIHVCVVFDDTNNSWQIWIDGQARARVNNTGSVYYGGGGNTVVGAHPSVGTFDFVGGIDDLRVYSVALTPLQIRQLAGWVTAPTP